MSSEPENAIQAAMRRAKALAARNRPWIEVETQDKRIILSINRDRYVIDKKNKIYWQEHHTVFIDFFSNYPHQAPLLYVQSPVVLHPNVAVDSGKVSMTDWDASMQIEDLIVCLWKLFALEWVDKKSVVAPEWFGWYEQRGLHLPRPENPDAQLEMPGSSRIVNDTRNSLQIEDRAGNEPAVPLLQPGNGPTRPLQSGFQIKGIRHHQPITGSLARFYQRRYQDIQKLWRYNIRQSLYDTPVINNLKVVLHKRALQDIFKHASGDTRNERFGILVGGVYSDPETQQDWVEIVEFVEAERVNANLVSVEVSGEEISRLNARVDDILRQTSETVRKMGWYHTHPGHGVFMSGTDRENQRFCYTATWHIAMVVDPVHYEYGIFAGPSCAPIERESIIIVSEADAEEAKTPVYTASRNIPIDPERQHRRELEHRPAPALILKAQSLAAQRDPRHFTIFGTPPAVPDRSTPPSQDPPPHSPPENQGDAEMEQHSEIDSQTVDNGEATPVPPVGTISQGKKFPFKIIFLGKKIPLRIRKRIIWILLIIIGVGVVSPFLISLQRSSQNLASQNQQLTTQLQQTQNSNTQITANIHRTQDTLLGPVPVLKAQPASRCVVRSILTAVIQLDAQSKDGQQARSALSTLPATYIVNPGDTIASIDDLFGLTENELLNANPDIKNNPNHSLQSGEPIKLPNC